MVLAFHSVSALRDHISKNAIGSIVIASDQDFYVDFYKERAKNEPQKRPDNILRGECCNCSTCENTKPTTNNLNGRYRLYYNAIQKT